jgi:hypothetical protein
MTSFIKFKENKNQIDFEIIDCMADIINNIVNDMYGFYKEHNIDTLITIDKRLDFHYEELKKYTYVSNFNSLTVPIHSDIIFISMHDNMLKKGRLLNILKDNIYLVQYGKKHLNIFLDAYYVFYKKHIKSKFRNTLQKILDGDIKIRKK